jgi:putative ABC transport system permease protein
MEFASTLLPAARAVLRNKMRSGLTMLGIIIGVAAVIANVSIGQGAGRQLQGQIANLGSNMLMIVPGSINRGGLQVGMGQTRSLVYEDKQAILAMHPTSPPSRQASRPIPRSCTVPTTGLRR